jgi:hypothetical protein
LDIYLAEYMGVPISWQSNNGNVHPAYYNAFQNEWTRAVAGGLMFTCGLRQVGTACVDDGVFYAQHGRIHNIPARHVSVNDKWENDEYYMTIKGQMEETAMFGENIRLTRCYKSKAGENSITIIDEIENIGFSTQQLMLLYHFNFGFPFVDAKTTMHSDAKEIKPQLVDMPLKNYEQMQSPEQDYQQRVYYHEIDGDVAKVEIINPEFPILNGKVSAPVKVTITWPTKNLPNLIHWKMPAAGNYVLGIEPSNCFVDGRIAERNNGTAVFIEAGQKIKYELKLMIE